MRIFFVKIMHFSGFLKNTTLTFFRARVTFFWPYIKRNTSLVNLPTGLATFYISVFFFTFLFDKIQLLLPSLGFLTNSNDDNFDILYFLT